jgi:hypothetical protein
MTEIFDKNEIELVDTMDNSPEHSNITLDTLEKDQEQVGLKDQEEQVYRYSRPMDSPIHYGNYIPLKLDENGVAKYYLGPDCKLPKFDQIGGFYICLNFTFFIGFIGMMYNFNDMMTLKFKICAFLAYLIQILCYLWVFVSDPGLATVPVVEFEVPLTSEEAGYFLLLLLGGSFVETVKSFDGKMLSIVKIVMRVWWSWIIIARGRVSVWRRRI